MTDRLTTQLFSHGSRWVRADFHLHTRSDSQFSYNGDDNYYNSNYIDALKKAGITIGVITNHNKFNRDEFDQLRKTAEKKALCLLPGVELSVCDGSNGIHTLIVFSDTWLEKGQDYINNFLNATFMGKTPGQYWQENGRSNDGIIETIKKLEAYHRDFFIIIAHVEQTGGLWLELQGGRFEELGANEFFRRRVLGFQKVRTHDKPDVGSVCRKNVRTWLKDWYPAEVEGSDPKNIDEIGKGKPIFIKIGAPTFEAVKLALCDYKYRVGSQIPNHTRSFVKEIHFDGGTLNGTTVKFSPGLNTLIGIRGSGKSSIIEALRYTLGIEPGEKAGDPEYKKKLLKHTLGSGGKITVTAVDSFGQEFTVRRILDHIPEVFINEVLQPGVSIRETIIQKPLYFGQKDLSNSGEGFERGLVEKLIGERLTPIRLQIEIQKERVQAALRRHLQLTNISSRREEYTAKKQNAEFQLERYRSYGIDEKLQKQTAFDSDISKLKEMLLDIAKFTDAVNELFMNHEDTLRNHTFYKSKQNEPFFSVWFAEYGKILQQLDAIKQATQEIKKSAVSLGQQKAAFEKIFNDLKEEFAAVERSIMDELKSKGIPIIRTDEFRHLSKTIDQATAVLQEVAKEEAKSQEIWTELLREISTLNDLWHQEFNLVKDEMEKVNANHSSLTINTEFEGDKAKFLEFLKEMLKGSGLREMTLQKLVDENANISTIFIDKVRTNNLLGDNQGKFWEYFLSNLESYLLRRVPDKYIIKYREKELKDHSLGQRASALILFILSQKANDLIIIDQPEDDLDNQTIYNDVIQQVLTLKNDVQFIFATHNPNFPVLGDAEMVVACEYISDQINITPGSIDHPETQARIVSIMEGGEDAFKRRKEIYKIWKPRNSMT